jgi:acetyl-CoA carboxylase carboxyltransferase component
MGLVANNPAHLAGAVDSPGADKGARFLQLCDAFDIPVVVLMDCPGIMVGPDHEREALVRHAVRMFNVGSNITTPMFGVMVRKAYGLGVQAMCAGSAMLPFFSIAWPTAEFAGMNIDGAVKLSARRELAAIEDPEARKAAYDKKVADGYESARAINSGARYVVDPAETRAWISRGLKSLPAKAPRTGKKRPYVDTW